MIQKNNKKKVKFFFPEHKNIFQNFFFHFFIFLLSVSGKSPKDENPSKYQYVQIPITRWYILLYIKIQF